MSKIFTVFGLNNKQNKTISNFLFVSNLLQPRICFTYNFNSFFGLSIKEPFLLFNPFVDWVDPDSL